MPRKLLEETGKYVVYSRKSSRQNGSATVVLCV